MLAYMSSHIFSHFRKSLSVGKNTLYKSMATSSQHRNLQGKVAVVTASTEGIGYAIAKRLAEDGAKVVVSSRKQKNVDRAVEELTKSGLTVIGYVCHVGKSEDRKALVSNVVSTLGGIDILISNAGINPVMCQVLDTPEESWDKIFDVNVKSAYLMTQEVLPHFEQRGGGSVVYVSSIAAYQPVIVLGAYSVSKTALLGLTKAAAIQCAPLNVRVNCICPGIIDTKFSSNLVNNDIFETTMKNIIPMKRTGKPEECAGLVSFLCSDDSKYITGESFVIAGGYFSRL